MKVLKKIIKSIKKFFQCIFNFFDKIIITPVTKFGLFLEEKIDKNAKESKEDDFTNVKAGIKNPVSTTSFPSV